MSTFDSTKRLLPDLLKDVVEGKIQLPDFQRGWVWDDDHIRSLLVSIARSFPVGAIMLLETGGGVRFQVRPVEGVRLSSPREPEKLILDGQQRLTSLTQAIMSTEPVHTRTAKGKELCVHYYFDIEAALAGPERLEDAIVVVDENRQRRTDFGRRVELDVSTRELECKQMLFPCDQVLNSDEWEQALYQYAPDSFGMYMQFRNAVLNAFRKYEVPIIELKKETSKEAVCVVFEKVNTGGVPLSVFELVTATYAIDGFNLRDDWFGSEIRGVDSRQARLAEDPLLRDVEATDFLQAVTLLYTLECRREDLAAGKEGKQVRPVSAKRSTVLDLPLSAYQKWADRVERGFMLAGRFLRKECFYDRREVPYKTQLIPLAAVLTELGERWLEPRIYDKLSRWFWCGVLGELYGGSVDTRIANDLEDLLAWFEDDEQIPRTVRDASFHPGRLDSLRTRLSAAYKGINVLVLREGARDFFWKATIQELDGEGLLDIHHIFPRNWCRDQGIKPQLYESIVNKTPISYRANRSIGGDPPSVYLRKLQEHPQVQLNDEEMDEILRSHCIPPERLRRDDFYGFYEGRRQMLLRLIEKAMGKTASGEEELLSG